LKLPSSATVIKVRRCLRVTFKYLIVFSFFIVINNTVGIYNILTILINLYKVLIGFIGEYI